MSSCAGGYPPPILWMESPCFHGDAGAMGCKILFAKGFAAESSAVRAYRRFGMFLVVQTRHGWCSAISV